jgi:hypothetical protein
MDSIFHIIDARIAAIRVEWHERATTGRQRQQLLRELATLHTIVRELRLQCLK